MITRRLLISTLPVIGLVGCAIAVGRRFQAIEPVPKGRALIYFFRSEAERMGLYPDIYVNGKFVGPLKRGGYLLAEAMPGSAVITIPATITWWPLDAIKKEIAVEEGKYYFINLHTSDGGYSDDGKRKIVNIEPLRIVSEGVAIPVLQRSVLLQ